jgi:hypothetical protein
MRELHDGLACGNDLPWLAQCGNDGPVSIGNERGIRGFVLGNLSLSFRRSKMCLGRIIRRFRLFVTLRACGKRAVYEHGIPLLVCSRLNEDGLCRDDRVFLSGQGKPQVGLINPHERLTGGHLLALVNKPLNDFAGDAEAQITLDPGRYCSGEFPLNTRYAGCFNDLDQNWS